MEPRAACNCPSCQFKAAGWVRIDQQQPPPRNEPIQWLDVRNVPIAGRWRGGDTYLPDGSAPGRFAIFVPLYWRRPPAGAAS